ncbi:MAG: helix-turn-helix transcriptional regulator [Clostridia bacterium]|nr:helix-turn-helix transcriptional regulator [Clostridia bacterium]
MKKKSLINESERELFSSGFRVTQGAHEFITYPANTSIRLWHGEVPDHYEQHFHSAVEVVLPQTGECVYTVDGEEYYVQPGEVMMIPAGCKHALRMGENSSRDLLLYEMNGVFTLKEFGAFRQLMAKPLYLTAAHPNCEQAHAILTELTQIYRAGGLLRNLHCYALLLELYAILGEQYLVTSASPAEMNALHRQLSGEDAFNRALDYVNENYMDDVTLDSLAAYAGFSRYTLSRMFRQHTGATFTQYLNKRRVTMAAELLAGTKMPVTQVALQCGFNSIATFNRVFRDVKGCTPTQYRIIYDESQRK